MDKHIKVSIRTSDGDTIHKLLATIPKPYRTKHEPDSAAEVYTTGYMDGLAEQLEE